MRTCAFCGWREGARMVNDDGRLYAICDHCDRQPVEPHCEVCGRRIDVELVTYRDGLCRRCRKAQRALPTALA